jgi:Ser/Thr protein kinase RdoA (MazF antagonist)
LAELYHAPDADLRSLAQHELDWRGIYRVERAAEPSWVLRACRADEGENNWLLGVANVLLLLERHGFPAPRVIRSRVGKLAPEYRGWWMLVTTFVEGAPFGFDSDALARLGAATSALHMLDLNTPLGHSTMVPDSWWRLDIAAPECLSSLEAALPNLPAELRELYEATRTTLMRFAAATDLPCTLIHGDCWPGNAVRAVDGDVTLIDWDCAGRGPAVLDLGNLLVTCHLGQSQTPHLTPNPELIAAVIEGYCTGRRLSEAELRHLDDAVAFGVVFHLARNFPSIVRGDWRENSSLAKLRARLQAVPAIAAISRDRLSRLG